MQINTLADITRAHRQATPDRLAMRFMADGREWTFVQLDQESCRCANALKSLGVGNQSRIAYLAKNEPEYFIYLYGGAKLGAVSVAVNWRLAPPEMEYILNHSESEVLLIEEAFLGHLSEMNLDLKHVVVIGNPADSGYPSFDQWLAGQSEEDILVDIDPNDPCYQLYTSGTTGLPKGVETTHANLVAMMSEGLAPLAFDQSSINLVCMPLFHISGSGWGVIGQYKGCRTILLREVDLHEILRVIEDEKITHTVFVPAVLQFLSAVPGVEQKDFSSLISVCYGASPITEEVLVTAMNLFKANFYQVYGLTETTGGITMLMADEHDPGGEKSGLLRSCGRPVANHAVKVVDKDTLEEMPEGEVGEIWIRGPQVMHGYWRNPEATKESIDAQGWFRSGDAGYVIDGYVYIHDRVKDMIISGGENIYPAEVENVLMKHPKIKDVAVIGVPSERWGEAVKAIVTPATDGLTEEEVFAFCRQQLAHYKCPTSVDWLEEIPRNPSGKILKTELRKPYWKGRSRNVG
ncbi:MAG: long-chain-fatty-acid--CoA ligase [Gammaproteobacteria bacterium]|nr:long-chain-fatty-acid--CoA ligase [Gammaproteobacteria bacterium]